MQGREYWARIQWQRAATQPRRVARRSGPADGRSAVARRGVPPVRPDGAPTVNRDRDRPPGSRYAIPMLEKILRVIMKAVLVVLVAIAVIGGIGNVLTYRSCTPEGICERW